MTKPKLYVLIEGDDDEMFFSSIFKPLLEQRYAAVQLWKYAGEPKKEIKNLLRTLQSLKTDYIFVSDCDYAPCVAVKRSKLLEKFPGIDGTKIFVVVREIESWFLAGIDASTAKSFRVKIPSNTEGIDKEQFEKLLPRKYSSKIDFMLEILKRFNLKVGRARNKSLDYFVLKNGLIV